MGTRNYNQNTMKPSIKFDIKKSILSEMHKGVYWPQFTKDA